MYRNLMQLGHCLAVPLVMMLAASPARAFDIVTVETSTTGQGITVGGTVIPYKEVTLTAQIPGRIEYLAGEEGDTARAGQNLVSIDDDDLLAKRRSAVAQYQQAEAALRNAGVQYSRELWAPQSENINRMPGMGMPGLFDQFFTRNMGSMMGRGEPGVERYTDLYSQGNQIRQAEAALMQARSQIDEIDAKLRDARSIAPFDGVIVRKVVEQGDTVQPGQPLLVFAQTEYLRIQAEIPARLMAGLERGMFVPARLDVGNVMVKARVSQIYPIADSQRHTVTVKFDLPKGVPGGPGMYAEITIPEVGGTSPTLPVIPMNALVRRGSLPYVFVLGSDNRAILRIVRTGHQVGDDRIAILAGLKPGERVIADPPAGIGSGWSPGENT